MKKLMLLAAGLVALAISAGCTAPGASQGASPAQPVQTLAQIAAKAQSSISTACSIAQPTLGAVQLLAVTQPGVEAFVTDANLACATNAALDTTTLNRLVQTSVPAAAKIIAGLPNWTQANKDAAVLALGAFGSSVQLALQQFNAGAAAAVPALGTSAALAPVAASQ